MADYKKYSKEAQEILKLISKRFVMDGKEKKELIEAVDDLLKEADKWNKSVKGRKALINNHR